MPFGFGRNVVGGGFADAIAAAIGGAPDSALQHMITPLNMLQTAAMLAGGSPNVTPAPQMPMSAAAQQVANRVAPQPTTTAGKAARFLTSMAVPVPGPAKERMAAQAGEELAPKILAYHGSPHAFDKFDASAIGTGEGAQSYGHGLYFAENEKTAQAYRKALSGVRPDFDGKVAPDLRDALRNVDYLGFDTAGEALSNIRQHPDWAARWDVSPPEAAAMQPHIDAHEARKYGGQGHMYRVGIDAHPDHFLDWDAPLSEQHPRAQDAFAKLGYDTTSPDAVTMGADGRWYVTAAGKTVGNSRGFPTQGDANYAHGVIAETATKNAKTTPGEIISNRRLSYTPQGLSDHLSEAGVPGIKYLDQGSRTAGDGTRNYVVFDPANIDILKRYGLAATLMGGAGAAAASAPSQPAQAPTRFGF